MFSHLFLVISSWFLKWFIALEIIKWQVCYYDEIFRKCEEILLSMLYGGCPMMYLVKLGDTAIHVPNENLHWILKCTHVKINVTWNFLTVMSIYTVPKMAYQDYYFSYESSNMNKLTHQSSQAIDFIFPLTL